MAVLNIVGEITITAGGAVSLTSSLKSIVGAVAIVAGGAAAGEVGSPQPIVGEVTIVAGGAVDGTRALQLAGQVHIAAGGMVAIGTPHSIRGALPISAGGSVLGSVAGQGLLVIDAVKTVTALWGLGCCSATGESLDDCLCNTIIGHLNACLQMIYSKADRLDYFNVDTLTVTITGGTNNAALAQGIQNLQGPIRRQDTKMPLIALLGIDELDNFVDYYYGGSAPEEPRAYYLDSRNQANSDNVALTLYVTPTPSLDTALQVDASMEPPRYTCEDARLGTPLQLPHKYAELLLLPLLRKWASANQMFTRREMQPQIDEQFTIAREALGMVQPETPAVRKTQAKQE